MSDQLDTIRLNEIDAVLEHLQQLKADTVEMVISLQRRRRKKPADPQQPAAGHQSNRAGSGSM